MTVIGLTSRNKIKLANKTQKFVKPFSKLRPTEKGRLILECFAKPTAVFNAIIGTKLIAGAGTTNNVVHLSDAARDKNFDTGKESKNANGTAIHARKQ